MLYCKIKRGNKSEKLGLLLHLADIYAFVLVFYHKRYDVIFQRRSPRGRFWPRGRLRGHILKSLTLKPQVLKNCPVLGSRTALFFEPLKFCWKTPETSRKVCKYLFCFPQLEHRLGQTGLLPPNWNFTNDKNVTKKAYCFFSLSFFLAFFASTSSEQQYWRPRPRDSLKQGRI